MFNQTFAHGMDIIPFNEQFPGNNMIQYLEFMQWHTIRAIIDAPFCSCNELIEIKLGFCKMLHLLWTRALNLRGKLICNIGETLDGTLYWLQRNYNFQFEVYYKEIMNKINLYDEDVLD